MRSLIPEHVRAARYLLGWTATDLAKAAMLNETTIRRFERGLTPQLLPRTERDIRRVLEEHGIVFEPSDSAEPSITCSDGLVVRRSVGPSAADVK